MTLPVEILEYFGKDACTEIHKLEVKLGIPSYKLWGVLMRIGLKYELSVPKDQWYVGIMFFWFGIFFGMRSDASLHDPDGRTIAGTRYKFSGLTVHHSPRKFKPGQVFWNHRIDIGKKEPYKLRWEKEEGCDPP